MFFPLKDENPTERRPILTIALISINLVIFVYMLFLGDTRQIINQYAMVPSEIAQLNDLHTLFTSMFLHGGFLHVISNLWFLWIFGDNIEDLYGRPKFLFIYFASGLLASIAHTAVDPASSVPTIGASGAVAGILGAYIVKYPRAKVLTFLFIFLFIQIIKVPSFVFIGIWIVMQVVSASITTITEMQVQVAYWAHIGGFIAGMIMAFLFGESVSKSRREITKEYFMES